jgi:hypothetical protein
MRFTKSTVLLLVLFALIGAAVAQTQFGTIYGRVTDSSGAVVPGAKVTLTNEGTKTSQTATASNDGAYTFASVPAGEYTLTAEKDGFGKLAKKFTLNVADRLTQDLTLKAGGATETVTVEANAERINTTTGDVSRVITSQEIQTLPLLTKNPYALIGLTPGATDTATATGDARGQGFAVNGQRTGSLNYMLDGAENNETFATGPAALVPNDAVQEFKVQANNNSAEFGRNAIVANVVTRSGTNSFHGSASEYYRGAALTANPVQNKVQNVDKPNYVRNDFTFSGGGPIIKDKTFFFASLEGLRVRSSGNLFFWVPTQEFVDNASPNMAAYVTAVGLPAHSNNCYTAGQFNADNFEDNNNDGLDDGPTLNANTGVAIPDATPLFCQTSVSGPIDAGGGLAQNTWNAVGKFDHRFTQNTQLSFRYAFTDNQFPAGAGSITPFTAFNTGFTFRSENYAANLTHSFSSTLVNESRLAFSRTIPDAPLGEGPVTVPCLQFGNLTGTPDGNPIVFPGYLPAACAALALPSGGPQNTITAGTGFTWSKGKQTFKFGGYMSHLRDNHTFGAFANANGIIAGRNNLMNGIIDSGFNVAFDPRGRVPGELYNPAIDGPFQAPSFTRHYHYNEVAFYGEDAIRLTNRLTVTLGLRWEYFGVLHSPDAEKALDANFYLDAVGTPKSANPSKSIFEQIRDGRFQRTGNFFNQDWNNFGPRIGFAWDVFGDASTSVRGGYGIFYDKNFGNALFNAIQNPPNYNVATVQPPFAGSALVDVNQYVTLQNVLGPGAVPIGGSARMLDKNLVTAYSQQWNASVEHDLFKKGVIVSATYVGTKGDKLYSLNNLNQRGSCILADPATYGLGCNPAGGRTGRLNQTGLTGMNRRGNEGFSRYHGITADVKTRAIHGLTLNSSYTYSVWKDNSSSFFGDSAYDNLFGFRDPFNPALDYSDSINDIRQKYVLSYNYEIPWAKNLTGAAKQILDGWAFSGVLQLQSGGAFSVFDAANFDSQCALSATNLCMPILSGSIPNRTQIEDGTGNNTYIIYAGTHGQTGFPTPGIFTTQSEACGGDLACTADLYLNHPETLSGRNLFRMPGFWNYDAALAKKFSIGERYGLELRAEAFNLFNHSNMYVSTGTNDVAAGDVTGQFGVRQAVNPATGLTFDRRSLQLGVKFTF